MALQSNQNVNEQQVYQQGGSGGEALLGAAALGGAGALAWKILRKGKGGAPKAAKTPQLEHHPGNKVLNSKQPKQLPPGEDNIVHQGTLENMRKQEDAMKSQNLQDQVSQIKSRRGRRGPVVEGNFKEVNDNRSMWQKFKDGVNQMQDAADHYGSAVHGDMIDWQNKRR